MSTMKLYLRNNRVFIAPREYGVYREEDEEELERYMDVAKTAVLHDGVVYLYIRQLSADAQLEMPDFSASFRCRRDISTRFWNPCRKKMHRV